MNGTLPEREHRRIFERLLAPNALRGTHPTRGRPRAIIVAGAPGSGTFASQHGPGGAP